MDLGHFTVMLYWLELNFCELNVGGEVILLLNKSSLMAWTSGKSCCNSYECLANAKRPCDCRVLCLCLKSSLCSCADFISDMTSFGCRDEGQGRDSVRPVL